MATTYTTNYHFGMQKNYADTFSMKVITDNWEMLDTVLADFSIKLNNSIKYQGTVEYYNDLPADPDEGDAYKVLYSGTTGTTSDGTIYAWLANAATSEFEWVSTSKDSYTKAEVDALISALETRISALEN